MKAIVVTDQAAGTAGMKLVERPKPQAAINDDVVYRCPRLGPLRQLHPGRSRSLVRYHDRLHHLPPDVWDVVIFQNSFADERK